MLSEKILASSVAMLAAAAMPCAGDDDQIKILVSLDEGCGQPHGRFRWNVVVQFADDQEKFSAQPMGIVDVDRKSTRLNSSHVVISYAVFCLKKKNQ